MTTHADAATAESSQDRDLPRRTRWSQGHARLGALGAFVGGAALVLAACGSSSPSSSGTTTSTSGSATTSTTPGSASATVQAGSTSNGTVLENSAGLPLYTYDKDTGTQSACTGACAQAWPPLTVPAGTTPKGGTGVSGTVAAVQQSNGTDQVTYDGKLVYTFLSDSAGKVTGNGVAGFSVVTLTSAGSGGGTGGATRQTTTTTSSSGGGYQY
jgi:predicted lipoprotein with Yx(FWY)xxD motif